MPYKWLKGPRIVLLAYTSENVVEKINVIGNLPCLPSELLHKRGVSHLFASDEKPSRWPFRNLDEMEMKRFSVPESAKCPVKTINNYLSHLKPTLVCWCQWEARGFNSDDVGVNELSSRDPASPHESLPQGNFSDHFFWQQLWVEAH